MLLVGVDLAWGEGTAAKPANETGLCVIDETGSVLDAGWARGIDAVADWVLEAVASQRAIVAVDAPLVVPNATGMREGEKQVGRAYGRWKVSANATNQALKWLGGVTLRDRLEEAGGVVVSGRRDPEAPRLSLVECYPFTTLVGMAELGYDDERPRYKRLPKGVPPTEARAARAVATDDLIARLARLDTADPPLDLASHPVTAELLTTPTPIAVQAHKHREDLIDAALCAWTAAILHRHGEARVQLLGLGASVDAQDPAGRPATIVAPARATQRLTPPAP
jgi:predicted RNase H-like nuclease